MMQNKAVMDAHSSSPVGFPAPWRIAGWLSLSLAALVVARVIYEETFLTWSDGPQMLGFAVAHGAVPLILFAWLVGLPVGLVWMLVSFVLLARKRFRVPRIDWIAMFLFVAFAALLSVPYILWEELVVRLGGVGPHGGAFLVEAAAHNDRRFVALLLGKGCDINYEYSGTTPLSAAANTGHQEMVAFLISRGAKVNRGNGLSGETALLSAAEMGQLGAVKLLLANGAEPCALDKGGHTAAGLAKQYRHPDVADYLSSRFHCPEKAVNPPCVDTAVSVCVH
jgi:hypothetical protein